MNNKSKSYWILATSLAKIPPQIYESHFYQYKHSSCYKKNPTAVELIHLNREILKNKKYDVFGEHTYFPLLIEAKTNLKKSKKLKRDKRHKDEKIKKIDHKLNKYKTKQYKKFKKKCMKLIVEQKHFYNKTYMFAKHQGKIPNNNNNNNNNDNNNNSNHSIDDVLQGIAFNIDDLFHPKQYKKDN